MRSVTPPFVASFAAVVAMPRASSWMGPALVSAMLLLGVVARGYDASVWEGKRRALEAEHLESLTEHVLAAGLTMLGRKRLDANATAVQWVVENQVPGDIVETGVWKGGSVLVLATALKYRDPSRTVWGFDSFAGLPGMAPSDARAEEEVARSGGRLMDPEGSYKFEGSVEYVRALMDEHRVGRLVRLVPGWFSDTLPVAPIERISVLRMDGDMYQSTIDTLDHLYHLLSPGGVVIVDDYGWWPQCRKAIHDWFEQNGLSHHLDGLQWIDEMGVYFQKPF